MSEKSFRNIDSLGSLSRAAVLGATLMLATVVAPQRLRAQQVVVTHQSELNVSDAQPTDSESHPFTYADSIRYDVLTGTSAPVLRRWDVLDSAFSVYAQVTSGGMHNYQFVNNTAGGAAIAAFSIPALPTKQDTLSFLLVRRGADFVFRDATLNGHNTAPIGTDSVLFGATANLPNDASTRIASLHRLANDTINGQFFDNRNFPVEWGNFSAYATGNNIITSWDGSTLENVEKFTVVAKNLATNEEIREDTVPSSNGQVSFAAGEGTYLVYIQSVDFNGEIGQSPTKEVVVKSQETFVIYPNPVNESLNVEFSGDNMSNVPYEIYDVNGRLVDLGKINSAANEINTTKLVKGMYVIHVTGKNGETVERKFVKQ